MLVGVRHIFIRAGCRVNYIGVAEADSKPLYLINDIIVVNLSPVKTAVIGYVDLTA
jgi:hypothetical protein